MTRCATRTDLIPPTHADLVRIAVRWLRNTRRCNIVFAELSVVTRRPLIPDAIGWTEDWSILVECKTSRSDFAADRSKPIHAMPDSYPGQERWYLAPAGLLTLADMPQGWCLAEVKGGQVCVASKLQSNRPVLPEGEYHCHRDGRAAAELPYLLSALRRHQLGVPFTLATGRFQTIEEREGLKK